MKAELRELPLEPLGSEAFAPFGEVIEANSATTEYAVNAGTAQRFHDLAHIDTNLAEGRCVLSLFRAMPRTLPFEIRMLERHLLGSQAFVPLDPATRFLVVVAEAIDAQPRAFLARGGQGVNYRRGTWHHPLIALDRQGDFLVIDREGPAPDCEEADLAPGWRIANAELSS